MEEKDIADIKKQLEEYLQNLFGKIPFYVIKIGVFAGSNKNIRKKDAKGMTNAEIMFVMEEGSPTLNIPARPVLEMTIKYAEENLKHNAIVKGLQEYLSHNYDIKYFEKELLTMCQRMESYVKKGIRHNTLNLHPNSPVTIANKGSDIPLLDTGQLSNSITARLYRYGTEEVKKEK